MNPDEYAYMADVEANHPWFVNRRRLIRRTIQRFGPPVARPRILDAGSGTGINLVEYAELGWASGVECDLAAARIGVQRGVHRVAAGDLRHLPFADSCFHLVVSTDVIEHIEDDLAALREMRRVLMPEGRIIVTTPAYSWAYSSHDRHLHHVRRYDSGELRALFARAELRVLHRSRYNCILTVPLLLARWINRNSDRSDVGRPLPRAIRPILDVLWNVESSLAARANLRVGMTHLAVLAK